MAIAYDTSVHKQSDSGTSITWTHTCTGSNLILLVCVMMSTSRSVSAISYNGVAMTFINRSSGGGAGQTVAWYYLINPATGANTVSITIDSSSFCYPSSASYTGVDQTSPIDASTTTANNAGSTITTTLTTTTDNCWTVLGVRDGADGATTASTGSTQRMATNTQIYDSNGPVTPAGSKSMTLTACFVNNTTTTMVAIKPFVAGSSRKNNLLTLGVS
jgi:hypothetical protein